MELIKLTGTTGSAGQAVSPCYASELWSDDRRDNMQLPEQQRCKNVDFKAVPTKESTSTNVTATHDVPGRKQDSKWKLFLITCDPDWPVRRSQIL